MAGNQNPFAAIFGDDPFGVGGGFSGGGSRQGAPQVEFNTNEEFNKMKDKFATMGKKAMIACAIIAVIVVAVAYWWFHPPINIHSMDTWMFIGIFILLPSFLFFRARAHAYKHGSAKVGVSKAKAKTFNTLAWIPVAVVALVAVGTLLSLSFFPGNAQKYANILVPADDEFTQDIQEVNYDEIPVIDRDSAMLLGNRTMGSMSDLVSQFEIAPTYSQINYQNHPVRVSPLGYADLFKWLQSRAFPHMSLST